MIAIRQFWSALILTVTVNSDGNSEQIHEAVIEEGFKIFVQKSGPIRTDRRITVQDLEDLREEFYGSLNE